MWPQKTGNFSLIKLINAKKGLTSWPTILVQTIIKAQEVCDTCRCSCRRSALSQFTQLHCRSCTGSAMLRSTNMQCLDHEQLKFKLFSLVLAHFCSAEFQQPQETRLHDIRRGAVKVSRLQTPQWLHKFNIQKCSFHEVKVQFTVQLFRNTHCHLPFPAFSTI